MSEDGGGELEVVQLVVVILRRDVHAGGVGWVVGIAGEANGGMILPSDLVEARLLRVVCRRAHR
jgi:hypothetical protein